MLIDLANGFVGGSVLGPPGDILGVAVIEKGPHIELLRRPGAENDPLRQDFDAGNTRVAGLRSGRAAVNASFASPGKKT